VPAELSALVVVDYQNVHLTGRDTFHRGGAAGDVVLLASHDTDLEPALDHASFRGRVETLGWLGAKRIRPTTGRTCWDTRLSRDEFRSVLDPHRGEYFA